MLKLENVSKFYSSNGVVTAGFSKVSLDLDVGEFVAITGASGSGKSTLLNVISGLDSFEEGEMYVMGQHMSGFGSDEMEEYRKRYIGNIFQTFNLINNYTVYQNVELVLLLAGYSAGEVRSRVDDIIKKVGLEKYRRTKTSKLSGGQKQRVAIARALAKDTPIIVADEPTGNLDVESAEGIFALLAGLAEDHLIIVVTHNYEQVEPYATRKITMNDGRVVEDRIVRAPEQPAAADEARVVRAPEQPAAADEARVVRAPEQSAAEGMADAEQPVAGSVKPGGGKFREARQDALGLGSGIRLGIRNAFSLPAKFVLLLVVSLFMCFGTTAAYSVFMSQDNAVSDFSSSFYFTDTSKDRVVVTKKDKTAFTEDDYTALRAMPNVGALMKYDLLLDHTFLISSKPRLEYDYADESDNSIYYYVAVRPIDMMPEELKNGITGALPQAAGESFLVATSDMAGEPWLDTIVGTELYITDDGTPGYPAEVNDKTKISGLRIMTAKETEEYDVNTNRGYWGAYLYLQDEDVRALMGQTLTGEMTLEANANGDLFSLTREMIHVTQYADPGEIYVTEDIANHYKNGVAGGNTFSVNRVSAHVRDTLSYSVAATVSSDNSYYWLDMRPQDLEPGIYMNESDIRALYASDQYQASVLMADVNKHEVTLSALEAGGYDALYIHEAASANSGTETAIIHALRVFLLVLEMLVLFFVSYFIMKLIFRSQNVYFSTIRMLGGNRRGCSGILLVDMLCVFHIAFGAAMAFLFMIKHNVILADYSNAVVNKLREWMYYIMPKDALILYLIVLGLTVLLAVRYSRVMFKKTAMNAYKEEV